MRVIAAGDTYKEFEKTKRYLSELKEGIVLFGELSFGPEKGMDWSLEDLAKYSKDFPMTLIGTKEERIHIVKKGVVVPAQFGYPLSSEKKLRYLRADRLHDVSYEPKRIVLALSRICADASDPYMGEGKADLLLISSCGTDWENRLDEILEGHQRKLNPDSLIVQCDLMTSNNFIYSLKKKKMVGRKMKGEQGDEYVVYDM